MLCVEKYWQNLFLEQLQFFNIPGNCRGPSKNGPYGPQGPWALGPTPFRLCRRALRGFLFGKKRGLENNNAYLSKSAIYLYVFAILANVDLNLRLKIYKIASSHL